MHMLGASKTDTGEGGGRGRDVQRPHRPALGLAPDLPWVGRRSLGLGGGAVSVGANGAQKAAIQHAARMHTPRAQGIDQNVSNVTYNCRIDLWDRSIHKNGIECGPGSSVNSSTAIAFRCAKISGTTSTNPPILHQSNYRVEVGDLKDVNFQAIDISEVPAAAGSGPHLLR